MWNNVDINNNNIIKNTGDAFLIKMPNNSEYAGFQFWHPAKCCRPSRINGFTQIGFTDSWKFTLKKMGKGKYNSHDVIEERTVSSAVIEEAFEITTEMVNDCKSTNRPGIEITEPEYRAPAENTVDPSLLV